LNFKAITISDKKTIDGFLDGCCMMGSECSFANMFIWQPDYNIEYTIEDGFLCLRGKYKDKPRYYLLPVGDGDKKGTIEKIINLAHSDGEKCVFRQLQKESAKYLEKTFPGMFKITKNRSAAEYIYKTESLITLKGRKLHSKRNHLNKFLKQYPYKYEEITKDNIDEAYEFALKSLEGRDDAGEEKVSIDRLFGYFWELETSGALLRVDDMVVAVTVGEPLNERTAVIHLEKADTDIDGAYTAINQMFAENRFSGTEYINREEDMGIEGLRRAKLSYQPEILLMKYSAEEV